MEFSNLPNELEIGRPCLTTIENGLEVSLEEVVVRVLLELHNVLVNHVRPLRREERDGTEDYHYVLIRSPLGSKGSNETLMFLIQVPTSFFQHTKLDIVSKTMRDLDIGNK